jgi:hypothetical protein
MALGLQSLALVRVVIDVISERVKILILFVFIIKLSEYQEKIFSK